MINPQTSGKAKLPDNKPEPSKGGRPKVADSKRRKYMVKYRLYDAITAALKHCGDWQSLRSVLVKQGISVTLNRDANGQTKGVCFTDDVHKISFAGSQIDRSLSYNNICRAMGRNDLVVTNHHSDDEYSHVVANSQENSVLSASRTHSEQSDMTKPSLSDDTTLSTSNDSSNGSSTSGANFGEAIAELVLQPHVVPSSSGGGGGSSSGWGNDDKDKDKNNQQGYRPKKRR